MIFYNKLEKKLWIMKKDKYDFIFSFIYEIIDIYSKEVET